MVVFLYESFVHRDRVPFNDFYAALCASQTPLIVPTSDEAFFRMKDLAASGFFELDQLEQGYTMLVKIREVRDALSDANIIQTTTKNSL